MFLLLVFKKTLLSYTRFVPDVSDLFIIIENTFSKTLKSDENAGNTEHNTIENIENTVVPYQNETKINTV
jgi:hypothetical protein